MTAARWYVVQTRPHAELKAQEHLRRQGFTTYLPKLIKSRRHARKVEVVARPLFPRYLFVLMDTAGQRWRAVRSTIGVASLMGGEDGPTPLRPGIVEALREQEGADGFFRPCAASFSPGVAIRVLDGLFASCLGFFEAMNEGQRISVLLDLLGRQVRVVLDEQSVAAA
jgi:transcriptional antiterminator RfaH